jgi:SAM-dependent methyltransferase
MAEADRYQSEKDFWDKHASEIWGKRKDYSHSSIPTLEDLAKSIVYLKSASVFFGDLTGKRIADLGCGDGWLAWSLAKSGGLVSGCDISPKSIDVAKRVAMASGIGQVTDFQTMPCEHLTYDDNHFDCVIMHAALHHCDLQKVASEIWRILKPGGKAFLVEDYAYHPVMRLYRRLTPDGHTPDEEALSNEDLLSIGTKFSKAEFKYFGLFNLFETSPNYIARRLRPILRAIDNAIYGWFPRSMKWSKLVIIQLMK